MGNIVKKTAKEKSKEGQEKIERMQGFLDWWNNRIKGNYIPNSKFVEILERV